MNTTFDFGNGPVPAHRHINPDGTVGGWVAETADVAKTAFVGVNARISDNARIYDNARISDNAQISGYARIYGNAWIYDNARISGGHWDMAPIYIQGSRHSATNCAPGRISIGCENHTFSEWQQQYALIGKHQEYTPEEIEEYKTIVDEICKNGKK